MPPINLFKNLSSNSDNSVNSQNQPSRKFGFNDNIEHQVEMKMSAFHQEQYMSQIQPRKDSNQSSISKNSSSVEHNEEGHQVRPSLNDRKQTAIFGTREIEDIQATL